MKIGDPVRVMAQRNKPTGMIVDLDSGCGWPWVLTENGKLVVWPESQLELLEDRELTDEDLECVIGGMGTQAFSNWRANMLNEPRKN